MSTLAERFRLLDDTLAELRAVGPMDPRAPEIDRRVTEIVSTLYGDPATDRPVWAAWSVDNTDAVNPAVRVVTHSSARAIVAAGLVGEDPVDVVTEQRVETQPDGLPQAESCVRVGDSYLTSAAARELAGRLVEAASRADQ